MTLRETTLKYVLHNLRYRWVKELERYSDEQVASAYEEFSMSEDYGNNDEKFLEWIEKTEGAR